MDILSDHNISYFSSGSYYTCYCVKHDDFNTPNMIIFPETNTFYCFACGFGTKPEHLIQELDGCSLSEAKEKAYGKDYIKDFLSKEKQEITESEQYLRLVVCRFIREELNKREISNILSHVKELDNKIITKQNLSNIITDIKNWR